MPRFRAVFCLLFVACPGPAATLTITFPEALTRAAQYGSQIQAASIAAQLAHEDRLQARAASLPTVTGLNQFIYTEGNGTPSGVFVANDGVHVYNEQLQAHEELLSFVRRGEIRLAAVSEAVARAKTDLATRGLKATVIQDYFAIAAADRKLRVSEESRDLAQQFVALTQKQEAKGEAAHADVLKAQLQAQQRERDVADARLTLQKAKITLSVLIFPALNVDYSVVDDLETAAPPESITEEQARTRSPDLRAATLSLTAAKDSLSIARYAYLPSLSLDVFYGIDANQFAATTNGLTQESGRSTLPNYLVRGRQNLGYSAQATLILPIWNWGSVRSKVKQASLRQRQAELDLTATTKQVQADAASASEEAKTSFAQIESLRSSQQVAAESLRLTLLRYEAGEATAFEVSDAETTASTAKSAYADGLLRFRVASAALQNLLGTL